MELLLFLTALLTGITGAFSGDRAAFRPFEGGAAVVRSADTGKVAAHVTARAAQARFAGATPAPRAAHWSLSAYLPLARIAAATERRLE